jgi:hypothetical protein
MEKWEENINVLMTKFYSLDSKEIQNFKVTVVHTYTTQYTRH